MDASLNRALRRLRKTTATYDLGDCKRSHTGHGIRRACKRFRKRAERRVSKLLCADGMV